MRQGLDSQAVRARLAFQAARVRQAARLAFRLSPAHDNRKVFGISVCACAHTRNFYIIGLAGHHGQVAYTYACMHNSYRMGGSKGL